MKKRVVQYFLAHYLRFSEIDKLKLFTKNNFKNNMKARNGALIPQFLTHYQNPKKLQNKNYKWFLYRFIPLFAATNKLDINKVEVAQ